MAKPAITEALLTSGQNEGIERSILPLPQLSSAQNARQRKSGRWGKRYGTATLSAVTLAGSVLGNGTNARRSIGPGFCTVDDRCYVYDQNAAAWVDPTKATPGNTVASFTINPRVPGAVSGWLPETGYQPVPALSQQNQRTTPCAQTYAIGYLWHAVTFFDPVTPADTMIRVVATNPTDNSQAFLQDIRAAAAGNGGVNYPRLVACGNTVVLTYANQLGVGGRSINARNLTSVAGGFGAEVVIEASPLATGVYDASAFSATQLVFAAATTTATNVKLRLVDAAALTTASTIVYVDANPTINGVGIVGAPGVRIYLTVATFNAVGPVNTTKVSAYAADLSAQIGTATVDANNSYPSYSVMLPGGGVRCVFSYKVSGAGNLQKFFWRDVTAAGALLSAITLVQYRFQPISKPFVVGSEIYVWCTNDDVVSSFGYATLLRLPALTEFAGTTGISEVSCPIEMSAQDFLIRTGPPTIDPLGIPAPIQVGAGAKWSFLAPTLMSVPDVSASFAHEFRAIQAVHYTDSAAYRSVNSFQADGCTFLPGGTLTRIDERGAVEEGFALVPQMYSVVTAAGGSLSVNSSYQWCCLFKCRSSNNRFEPSGISAVIAATTGAADTQATISFKLLEVSARASVQIELYRTLPNGSVFYLTGVFDGGPDIIGNGARTFVDKTSDATLATRPVLYTQVGQTLPNCFPPPSRFGCVGAQRIHLGGLLRNDVSHSSKLMLGDQSPSFADNDAFRIVWPSTLTGLAFMDNLIGFTDEGVYVVSGDGPDDSGDGQFSPPQRLPYADGCMEPRSIFACDEGVFYQTRRGLYMIPRGFGPPIPAGDVVMDTLSLFPIITGVAVVNKFGEQTIRWTCVEAPAATAGRAIVYDLAHKCWSVDIYGNVLPHIATGQWFGGEVALAGPTVGTTTQKVTSSTYDDEGAPLTVTLATGDLRPFGSATEGVISKIMMLSELRSACTMLILKTTEFGTSPFAQRVFALAAGDYQVGSMSYTETDLGNAELRDVVSLRIGWTESSTSEGLAFVAFAIEHEQSERLKSVSPLSRTT